MQPLDLYATIEQDLNFSEEVESLHNAIANLVFAINPSNLIDIGCGQGDFCIKCEDNGIHTLGADLSEKQIEIAKEKGINAVAKDIKDINDKFDCATATFDVINYLPKNYLSEFLTHTYNLLNNGGYFIFDINSLFGFEEVAQGTLVIDKDDRFISIDAFFEDDILSTNITLFTKEGNIYNKQSGTIEQYYYSENYLRHILEKVGFSLENVVNFNLHSDEENDKQIFICKK